MIRHWWDIGARCADVAYMTCHATHDKRTVWFPKRSIHAALVVWKLRAPRLRGTLEGPPSEGDTRAPRLKGKKRGRGVRGG